MSIAVFAQGMNASETIESTVQKIAGMLRDMSPILLIGLGILLIFIQKFAKIVGIILLVIGIVRLVFLFL
jgi:hypothetical protein